MRKISKKEITSIVKEFKALAKGQNIIVNLPPIKLDPISVHISWQSDVSCETSYDDKIPSYKLIPHIDEITDKAMDKHRSRYNRKITKFLNKVSNLEKKYDLSKDRLWNDYLWPVC